jgi:nucleotide-binding universal stress UspA family protein
MNDMYQNILVPLDGSEFAEEALPHAIAIAKAFKSRVTLVMSIEAVAMHPEPGVIGPILSVSVDLTDEIKEAKDYLGTVAGRLSSEGIEVHEEVVEGAAAASICAYAHDNRTDLIVMTTHGLSGLQRLFYGSVAEKVLHGARIPVLLVRILDK